MEILQFNVKVLKCLFFWPWDTLTPVQNIIIQNICFFTCTIVDSFSSASFFHQLYIGIDDINIAGESLIHLMNFLGFAIVFQCNQRNHQSIKRLLQDFNDFKVFCDESITKSVDKTITKYTKWLLIYGITGLSFNTTWPLFTKESCMMTRTEYFRKHDPCGMSTHNWYPFDASKVGVYWVAYILENFTINIVMMGFVFCPVTVGGFLMHIISQLQNFKRIFIEIVDRSQNIDNENDIKDGLKYCVMYHQAILSYAKRVFDTFSHILAVYITMASFTLAAITYQVVILNDKLEDRIRFLLLLCAWVTMFFMICLGGQKITDESLSISEVIYNSNWYDVPVRQRKYILMIMTRGSRPLQLKAEFVGYFSLPVSVNVLKTAYSCFTLLLTIIDSRK